jgi:glycosyltransferase involved in cell wall biosynthesis
MKIILLANTDWYLYNYRLSLARELQSQGHDIILISPNGNYVPKLEKAGFCWKEFSLSRHGMNPFTELITIYRLKKLFSQEKPNLIHNFTIKCVLYGSLAAHIAGIKNIINSITGRGILFSSRNLLAILIRPFIKLIYRISLKHTKVIFQNQTDLDYFVKKHLVSLPQCYLIPGSGVDLDIFNPAPFPKGEPLIILPARMLWAKGISEFIEASKIVKEAGFKARFALIGEPDPGNPNSIPLQKLEEWKKEGIIEWWGWQDDMVQVYQSSSIVCLLSSYGEGLAKSLIEAAACGRPLVASDIPGCREVVLHGKNGYLVPVRDPTTLAFYIEKLLNDQDLALRMGKYSRIIAVKQFSAKIIVKDTINAYNSI